MLVLFSFEEELKRARQTGAFGFTKTLNNRMEGNYRLTRLRGLMGPPRLRSAA
jgi:hypothetical protein